MTDIAIRVNNLSKQYHIGTEQPRYKTIRETLTNTVQAPFQRAAKLLRGQAYGAAGMDETIWALRNASFEVKQGEVIGVIGRNGAGKTTLLKILSRITEPTEGRVEIHGHVGSLLEVGTGFHPELTGRENIFLNAAILGMKKREILKKFDEIVTFAEIEKFIDTPVKFYSSGMYVRLAFSVAAHLEPDILLVDEVLAVGDVAFQRKCLGKMGNVSQEGRTVIFVSHNMGAIQQLCSRAILLDKGRIITEGHTTEVVNKYLMMGLELEGERVWSDRNEAPGDETVRLRAVRALDRYGKICSNFDVRDPFSIQMEYWVFSNLEWLDVSVHFYNHRGELIFVSIDTTMDSPLGGRKRLAGFYKSTCRIPPDLLSNGQIYIRVTLTDEMNVHVSQRDVVILNIGDVMDPEGARGNYKREWPPSAVRPRLEWDMKHFSLSQAPEPGKMTGRGF
ncbi:ABC transporter ATP-binding protein [Candidatus Omnitrophota bacterium]